MSKSENNCPFCKTNNKTLIGYPRISEKAKRFIRKEYTVVKCRKCKFYFTNPVIDLALNEWQTLYADEYFTKMTKWHEQQRLKDLKNRFNRIETKSKNKIINFLDVGCGEGFALIEAIRRGWKTYGIDIADNRTDMAKNNLIVFNKGELLNLNFPSDFFDAIYMDSVLEHLLNPLEYLKELNRILKKGGVIYIGVPNEDSLFNDFRRIAFTLIGRKNISEKIKPFESPYHVVGFTKKSLRIAAETADLKVLEIKNFAARFEVGKYHAFSRGFWIHLLTLPVDLLAIVLRQEVYLEAFLSK